MRLHRLLPLLLAAPLLTACIDDRTSWHINGVKEHSLTLIREQPKFWDNTLDLYLVVSRMPECSRRHRLGKGTEKTEIEVWQVPSGAFVVKMGKKMFATETRSCESWAELEEALPAGMAQLRGRFRQENGKMRFVEEAPVTVEMAGEAEPPAVAGTEEPATAPTGAPPAATPVAPGSGQR